VPVIVLNSHTHNDHVGDNWQFDTIYSMDTDFTRQNAKGSVADAQAEIAPGEICGDLPKDFDAKSYRTKPWTITKYIHDGDKIDLGGRQLEIISTPGHTPDAICLFDRANRLLFTGACASGKNRTWRAQYSRGLTGTQIGEGDDEIRQHGGRRKPDSLGKRRCAIDGYTFLLGSAL
jgi:glyoxylase-like metal-dependent hydrolase (beta-lactamase superfamily II)